MKRKTIYKVHTSTYYSNFLTTEKTFTKIQHINKFNTWLNNNNNHIQSAYKITYTNKKVIIKNITKKYNPNNILYLFPKTRRVYAKTIKFNIQPIEWDHKVNL
jgi:hypothetical protein